MTEHLFDPCPTCQGSGYVPNLAAPAAGQSHRGGDATEKMPAREVALRTGDDRHLVLTMLYDHPEAGCTDYELSLAAGRVERRWVLATRRGELARLGYVERTEMTRGNDAGRACRVWLITPGGVAWIDRHGRHRAA